MKTPAIRLLALMVISSLSGSIIVPSLSAQSSFSGDSIGTTTNSDFILNANNTERMRLTTGGIVQISSVGGYLDYRPNGAPCTAGQGLGWSGAVNAWACVSLSGSSGWGLTGNAGTSALTNFLGTTDAQDLVFKTNNTEYMRLTSSGNVGIGTNAPSARLAVSTSGAINPIGPELITNGGFTGSAAGWTLGDCATYGANQVDVTYTACADSTISTSVDTVAGNIYMVTFDVVQATDEDVGIFFDSNIDIEDIAYTVGAHTVYFTANFTGTDTIYFHSLNGNINGSWSIDNISIRETDFVPAFSVIGHDGASWLTLGDISSNFFLGKNSGGAKRGVRNFAIGNNTLFSNIEGYSNFAIGSSALYSNTSGDSNLAIGSSALYSNTSGYGNMAVGMDALHFNTTGMGNFANGAYALYSNTTGWNNTAIGNSSLSSNQNGAYNVALGASALSFSISANDNTAVGNEAMFYNTVGESNTAIGEHALRNNISGNNNVANGFHSLYLNVSGSNNTANGYGALYNSTGSSNSVLGYRAGGNLQSGANNIAIGANTDFVDINGSNQLNIGNWIYGSGGYIGIGNITPSYKLDVAGQINAGSGLCINGDCKTAWSQVGGGTGSLANGTATGVALRWTGTGWSDSYARDILVNGVTVGRGYSGTRIGNTTLGSGALNVNGSGAVNSWEAVYNTAVGENTLSANTTGFQNTSIGVNALSSNTTGSNNTANGLSALSSNTIGGSNTANGVSSLYFNTIGGSNTAIGVQALMSNVTGGNNSALGYNALAYNTTGSYNSALGWYALSNFVGSYNSAFGAQALANYTGTGNTAVGYYAGQVQQDGNYNTILGFSGNLVPSTNFSNSTALGAFAYVRASNTMVLGSVNGVNGATADTAVVIGSGASSSGAYRLDVQRGFINSSSGLCINGDCKTAWSQVGGGGTGSSQWTSSGSDIYYTIGNVGIGTNSPTSKLDLKASITLTGSELVTNGGFTGNASSWYLGDCAIYGSNKVTVTKTVGCTSADLNDSGYSTSAGKMYRFQFTISGMNPGANVGVWADMGFTTNIKEDGTYSFLVNSQASGLSNLGFILGSPQDGDTFTVDDVSVVEVSTTTPALQVKDFNGDTLFSLGVQSSMLENISFGKNILKVNTTGNRNVAIGNNVLKLNTSGYQNSALGNGALYSNIDGGENSAIGNSSLYNNISGGGNSAIGSWALLSNTNGSLNTAAGLSALQGNITGGMNVAVGTWSMNSNVSGQGNTAVGNEALYFGNGDYNTAYGWGALYGLVIGNDNLAMGAGSSGYFNSGSNNVFLGSHAGSNLESGDYNIAIGANTYFASTGASNQLNIGNWIYGSGGYIGIGIQNPAYQLDVSGSVQAVDFLYSSDMRLKTNIVALSGALDQLLGLHGYAFDWKKDGHHDIGVIAQEVEKIFPQIVSTSPVNGMKSVEYGNLVAPIIEAIRELRDSWIAQSHKVEELQNTVNRQQQQIDALMKRLDALENK